ncbi:hypothetical protein ACHAWU_006726, partial [Discostella pseudostelligera]
SSSSYTPKPKQRNHSSDGNNISTFSADDDGGGGNASSNNNDIIPPPPRQRSSVASSVKSTGSDPAEDQRRQDRKVCLLRGGVVITLLTATTIVATLVGLYVKNDEHSNFQTQYDDSVSMVAESFQNRIDIKYNTAKTFSAMITSRYGNVAQAVIGEEPIWPNVTIPDFQEQAKAMLTIADGRAISFNPIITQDVNRLEWEAHATATAEILGDPLLVTPDPDTEWPDNRTVSFGIYSRDKDKNVIYDPGYAPNSTYYKDVMVPVWQIAPIENNSKAIMYNLHSETNRQQALDHMLRYQVADLTAFLQLVQDVDTRPSAILFYPVFDVFRTKAEDGTVNPDQEQTVVGSISIVFSWDMLLNDILPSYIKGMICVLHSSTGESFSYHISGDEVHLMGEGDLHDVNYDKYEHNFEARLLLDEDVQDEINSEIKFIVYTLSIYPSEEFESEYVTNRAAIYAIGVVLIFLFTAGLFLLYDYLVEDRQQRTARLAKLRGNIVDSMFPAAFRDRLYKVYGNAADESTSPATPHMGSSASIIGASIPMDCEYGTEKSTISGTVNSDGQEGASLVPGGAKRRSTKLNLKKIDKFMKGVRSPMNDENLLVVNPSDVLLDDPIADLFPDTSIMFSDIVGFTKWSSEHSPAEVFQLLEQIFWEFDSLASLHNVFKLGTIGDCYIAVTGIPDPIDDHAIVLTRFAFDARDKVREVCARLESEGLDTAKLDMRFGIHSGATTAGILRGTKSRFELFGDTINTASRMESTGIGGKIQVSEETAELIRLHSKSRWLTKRDTKIFAKGKGELQTYWVEPERAASRVSFSEKRNDNAASDEHGEILRRGLKGISADHPSLEDKEKVTDDEFEEFMSIAMESDGKL